MADEGLFGGGAAFGVYPQMGGRRRLQDPQASADVPLQVLRGRLAGLLGLPSDIGNLIRSPMPMEMFGDYEYEKPPQLPYTTEQFLKELPLAPTSPVGQLAGQVGSFVPLSPMPAIRGAQTVGRMVGQRMAENVAMGRPSLPSMLAEPRSSLFAVEPSPMMPKPQAQVSELGFYSAAEQAAMNLPRNKGTGQSFLNDLMKAPDVKKDELAWTGLDDFLANKPNVTKQEVQDFIANNRVDVQEVRLGDALPPTPPPVLDAERLNFLEKEFAQLKEHPIDAPNFGQEKFEELMMLQNIRDNSTVESLYSRADSAINAAQRAQARGNKDIAERYFREAEMLNFRAEALDLKGLGVPEQVITNPTKYDQYQLPGGENYREILLTLPFKEPAMPKGYQVTSMQYDDGTVRFFAETPTSRSQGFMTQEEAQEQLSKTASNLKGYREKLESYQSSHFNEPNILAHIRVNDRVDADGKKMLLIEEIQSDWHQAGREKGYKGQFKDLPNDYKIESKTDKDGYSYYEVLDPQGNVFAKDYSKGSVTNQAINRLNETVGGVPDAPFKDTWYQLALKRVLKHAADNGYERVGLTTGKQQADRYKMSNEVNSLAWRDAGGGVKRAISLELVNGDNMTLSVNNEGKVMGGNLQDKSLSSVLGKDLAKKIMAEDNGNLMGNGLNIGGEGVKKYYDEVYPQYLDKYGKKWNAKVGETEIKTGQRIQLFGVGKLKTGMEPVRYIDITPEMKGAVSKGQPLFAAVPVGSIGLGYQKDKIDNVEETSLTYTDPFGNTIGSSIR